MKDKEKSREISKREFLNNGLIADRAEIAVDHSAEVAKTNYRLVYLKKAG